VHKPHGMIVAMFGPPSRFAHEPQSDEDHAPDEDHLSREGHGDDGDEGPVNTLDVLYRGLKNGSERAASDAQAVAQCLQKMAHCASRDDQEGLDHWYEQCCDLIESIDDGGERDGER
jgi:hypothetical protein